ncbi:hypothetical protein ACLOJK_022330 [Asimina triloba]
MRLQHVATRATVVGRYAGRLGCLPGWLTGQARLGRLGVSGLSLAAIVANHWPEKLHKRPVRFSRGCANAHAKPGARPNARPWAGRQAQLRCRQWQMIDDGGYWVEPRNQAQEGPRNARPAQARLPSEPTQHQWPSSSPVVVSLGSRQWWLWRSRVAVLSVKLVFDVIFCQKGYKSFLLRDLPFDAIQFCIYEQLRIGYKLAAKRDLNDPENAIIGACAALDFRRWLVLRSICHIAFGGWIIDEEHRYAGAITGAITTPLDVIKTRLMVQGSGNQYGGILDCVQTIVREEGPTALLKGLEPRVLWIGVGGFIFFGVLERTKALLSQRRTGMQDLHKVPKDSDGGTGKILVAFSKQLANIPFFVTILAEHAKIKSVIIP